LCLSISVCQSASQKANTYVYTHIRTRRLVELRTRRLMEFHARVLSNVGDKMGTHTGTFQKLRKAHDSLHVTNDGERETSSAVSAPQARGLSPIFSIEVLKDDHSWWGLPANWEAYWSADRQAYYFCNTQTGSIVWEPPAAVAGAAPPAAPSPPPIPSPAPPGTK
jgi:hypothetical protein